ncbi:Carbonic anhydrase 14 [Bulinus truncatus]|nr:Carbonic anhydrase 14 [Bulinus truncatus]
MLITLLLALTGLSAIQGHKWSYDGDDGALNWHKNFPNACSGQSQSPIDIRPEETIYNRDLKDFAIWYDPPRPDTKFYIKNNGHTAQVDLEGDLFVSNGGLPNVYKAAQFHFHWGHKVHHGSEHTIDGKSYPIELHIVTYNSELFSTIADAVTIKGGLAVLGVMFEVSEEDNPALEHIIRSLKHIKPPKSHKRVELPPISIRDLLPSDITRYFRYNGSLTTPNCFESVIWTVFDRPQSISASQLAQFRHLLQIKHKKGGKDRHRRSLSKAQQKLESTAEDILQELSLSGDEYDETFLKAKLMQEMLADMPVNADSNSDKSEYKPSLEEDRASKINKNINSDKRNSAEDKHGPTPAASGEHHSAEDEEHDPLVNNFRPVQPLHGRLIHRSFKLSVPAKPKEEHLPEETKKEAFKSRDTNSVGQAVASVSVLLLTLSTVNVSNSNFKLKNE